ncbi:MAG: NifB/NifX family molybdenum-iron cluster-binding protein [Victivallales bacterium]|jgi:predicted Fe-Mo cluster-binding NifX family protein|nr:NifB/NifX family molybdenum-iron cluster-binding protein [Victivallales bacterium]MBT7301275.1 NifB/NifX family molybdenum-iron cluster-binding protein [Victivallales bacterium]
MKIAVSTSGTTLGSPVDPRFGRAAGFLVVDLDSDETEYIENTQNLRAAQGAGIQTAQNVANTGAEVVLTGHCGPKAFRVLGSAGVALHVGAEGTVAEALARFQTGDWEASDGADVEGHWA